MIRELAALAVLTIGTLAYAVPTNDSPAPNTFLHSGTCLDTRGPCFYTVR